MTTIDGGKGLHNAALHTHSESATSAPVLVVQRSIDASAAYLFDAWTQVERLMQWWGPRGVTCPDAEIDLRVGGRFRIGNRFADGGVVWISGVFEHIDRPHLLVFSWSVEPQLRAPERVSVHFAQQANASTLVTVRHERIADPPTRASHELGWIGCLDGLQQWAGAQAPG